MASRGKNFRVTLEQLRIYKKQPKNKASPCQDKLMKLVNALEASQGKINGPTYKYVKEFEQCIEQANKTLNKKGQAGTLYYLSQYLDVGGKKK